MAALYVSLSVSTSRESLIDDCQDPCRPFLLQDSRICPLLCLSKLQGNYSTTTSFQSSPSDMIIKGCLRAQLPRITVKRTFRTFAQPARSARRYSTANAPPMASSIPQSQASMLATITSDLDKIAPRFEMQSEQITIIQSPAEFYETLKVGDHILPSYFTQRLRCQNWPSCLCFPLCVESLKVPDPDICCSSIGVLLWSTITKCWYWLRLKRRVHAGYKI